MRIASVNILHGIDVRRLQRGTTSLPPDAVDLSAVADWIAGMDADVVVLQEVDSFLDRSGNVDQVAWLADRLDYDGVFCPALTGNPDTAWEEVPQREAADGGLPSGAPAYGVGIMSRVGLADVVRTRLPYGGAGSREPEASPTNPGMDNEPRVAVTATVADGLRVSTTHLSYMFWWAVPQLGRAMRAATRGHDGPGVFLGDFNLPMWGGWLALNAWGLNPWRWPEQARASAGWRYIPGQATYPSWKPRLQLDQTFVRHIDDDVRVVAGEPGPSDHLPLIVEV